MFKKTKNLRWLFAVVMTVCIMLFTATTALANTLTINYNSGSEKKLVITGPVLTADQERVFTASELKQLFANDIVYGDLHYFTMNNTVLSKRAYTVRGISLWDVFDYSGIPTSVYRNADYFLHTVSTDGFTQVIGPGVQFDGQGGTTETGTLDLPRYSHYTTGPQGQMAVTLEFTEEIDSGNGVEMPWVVAFAENYNSVFDGPTGVVGNPFFPEEASNTSQSLRPFFGQAYVTNQNLPLSVDGIYRLVFADGRLSVEEVRNVPASQVFSLNGTMYDRAHILTGAKTSSLGGTSGQKVKGFFTADDGGVTYFEGTNVLSLINSGSIMTWDGDRWIEVPNYVVGPGEYALFENAAGENVVVSYEEISANKYTLVYREGGSADDTTAIEREVNGTRYYFDLYRAGAPVVQNISGISRTEKPKPVVLDAVEVTTLPSNTAYSVGGNLDLTGLVVKAVYSDNSNKVISTGYTASPSANAVLNTVGTTKVTISYSEGGITKSADFNVTVTARISFDANGGTVSPATRQTGINGKLAGLPTPVRSGHVSLGWFTAATGGEVVSTDTVFSANATIYARWTEASPDVQLPPTDNSPPKLEYTQSGGSVTLELSESKIIEFVDKSKEGAVAFDISKASGATSAILPKAALVQFADAELDMKLILPQGTLTLDTAAVKSVAGQVSGENISLELYLLNQSTLTTAQKNAVKPNDLVFNVSISAGAQTVTAFSGKITVSVPYSGLLPAAVWYLNSAGELEKLESVYDASLKTITFTTNHLSLYVVGFDAAAPYVSPFTDVKEGNWFYDDVKYVYLNSLMNGMTADSFAPNESLTRGMVITVLYRMAGSPDVTGLANPFTDVPKGKYYTEPMIWAANNRLAGGYGDGLVGPENYVTREDLVIFLLRYADFAKMNLPAMRSYTASGDDESISEYARFYVERGYCVGIINGKDGSRIDAKGLSTRAEFAAMLHRMLESAR